jgi:hypothetical protein
MLTELSRIFSKFDTYSKTCDGRVFEFCLLFQIREVPRNSKKVEEWKNITGKMKKKV